MDNFEENLSLFPENTVPVKAWEGDPNDTELLDLIPLLESLGKVEDVTTIIKKTLTKLQEVKDPALDLTNPDGSNPLSKLIASEQVKEKFNSAIGALGENIKQGNGLTLDLKRTEKNKFLFAYLQNNKETNLEKVSQAWEENRKEQEKVGNPEEAKFEEDGLEMHEENLEMYQSQNSFRS